MRLPVNLFLFILHNFVAVTSCFDLTILHTNDVHARIEQMNKYGGTCGADDAIAGKCFGGVARRFTKVREVRDSHSNVILLDGGDQFQGTLWYNYYRGNATAFFNNKLNYTVGALGNHEFDDGPANLARYMRTINFPLVACNVDSSKEPLLSGLYKSSVVIDVGGERIGVTGFLTNETKILVPAEYVENIVFTPEVECLKAEVQTLQSQGINKIIALGHAGFGREQDIVRQVEGIDILVGGHTNTFLYNGPPPSNDQPVGPYPTVVSRSSGTKAYVVQDFAFGKYLGYLNVTFDQQGVVTSATGNPILLDSSIIQDPGIMAEINNTWAKPIRDIFDVIVGQSHVDLVGDRFVCRVNECNLGNLITDAILYEHLLRPGRNGSWSEASICVWNSGGIRNSLQQGTIDFGSLSNVLPFRNEAMGFKLLGKYLIEMLEHSASQYYPEEPKGGFLQVSGIHVVYDMNKPEGERVLRDKLMIQCSNCTVPAYEPFDPESTYGIVSSAFLIGGGDGYSMLREHATNNIAYGTIGVDAVRKYITQHSPIVQGVDNRIKIEFNTPDYSDVTRPTNIASGLYSRNTGILMTVLWLAVIVMHL